MRLFFTKLDGWSVRSSKGEFIDSNSDGGISLGLQQGAPFFLQEDGSYDIELSQFFASVRAEGVESANSWKAYATDLLTFFRFLSQARAVTSWKDATQEDLLAYRVARREPASPTVISAQAWNRSVIAIERLYRWAKREGLISMLPYVVVPGSTHPRRAQRARFAPHEISTLRDRRGFRIESIRYLSKSDYEFWRDVGLRGRLPDGRLDPTWRSRNGERNALMADLLVTTGMRIGEAGSILRSEIEDWAALGEGRTPMEWFTLGHGITKGGRPRRILLPRSVGKRALRYIEFERQECVERSDARGPQPNNQRLLRAEFMADGRCRVNGEKRPRDIGAIAPDLRRRILMQPDDSGWEHATLFLAESSSPMTSVGWTEVFRSANRRCARFGKQFKVSPHWLRHTFAIHFLEHAIVAIGREVMPTADRDPGLRVYDRVIGDPLRTLQLLLGHGDIETTHRYLDYLGDAASLVREAAARWARQATRSRRVG